VYEEAERLYRRALDILERVYGPEHHEVAVTLNNLAALAHARGRNDEAETLFQRALTIKERVFGPNHPDVAMTLNNLAVFYKSLRNYERAESLYQRSLSIFERALGPDHFKVAACLDNYARLLWKMGRQDQARKVSARAKAILRGLDVRASKDVVATATINPQFACFAMSVRRSPIHRWGVFAGERIPAEREVVEYTGERILAREAKRRPRSRHYLFSLDRQWMLDGAVGGSGAELINHSCEPNLHARLIKGRIFYFSKREIEAGEELTVDYAFAPNPGPEPCLCGSPKCRGTINVKPKAKAVTELEK
jgi:tetratricopeptide (TPR) repeat protein